VELTWDLCFNMQNHQKRKLISAGLLSLVCLTNCSFTNPALAQAGFTYSPPNGANPGKVAGDFAVDKVGKIALPRGIVSFAQDELIVQAVPGWLFDRNVVFKGPIVRAEAVPQNNSYVLGGLAVMLDGLWTKSVLNGKREAIETIDGGTVSGEITGRVSDALVVKHDDGRQENILFNRIKAVRSPRAFIFNIQSDGVKINPADSNVTFTARSVVISPANSNTKNSRRTRVPRFALAGTEAGISKKALAVFVALDILNMMEAPIVLPLVLNARNQHAAKRAIADAEYQSFVQSLQGSSPPPPPPPPPPAPSGG
jgi:hypothetical protein